MTAVLTPVEDMERGMRGYEVIYVQARGAAEAWRGETGVWGGGPITDQEGRRRIGIDCVTIRLGDLHRCANEEAFRLAVKE